MKQLTEHKDAEVLKIITGVRGCGKSTLLDLFEDYLLSSGVPRDSIIHINMDSLRYRNISDHVSFSEYINDMITGGAKYYLILDEIQRITEWEQAIHSIYINYNVDIYIAGSDAGIVSSTIDSLFPGQYEEIHVLPLSFKYFLLFQAHTPDITTEEKFHRYLQFGGMPLLRQFQLNDVKSFEALEGAYNTLLLRDVLEQYGGADPALIRRLTRYLCENIGKTTSPNKIGQILSGIGGKNIAGKTVDRYIQMLSNAYVFYPIGRYDIKGKQLLTTLGKYYIADLGFRSIIFGYNNSDKEYLLENIVYFELLRRGYRVFIGKLGSTEIDFVAFKQSDKLYIQVTASMSDDSIRENELRPLRSIRDNYEKIVISTDSGPTRSYDGIKSINIIDFLL